MTPDDLVTLVSAAIAAHDPLDPWITESHWDEHYWDAEARQIAPRLARNMSPPAVRAILVEALGNLLGSSADGQAGLDEQARRLDLIAQAISYSLGPDRDSD